MNSDLIINRFKNRIVNILVQFIKKVKNMVQYLHRKIHLPQIFINNRNKNQI
jgi:hypothetical protein